MDPVDDPGTGGRDDSRLRGEGPSTPDAGAAVAHALGWLVGRCVGDCIITRAEIQGLLSNLLYTNSPPAGDTKLTTWAKANGATLGRRYASELARR